ncbi:hypothetical protein ABZP36_007799 [Zizania latifolia]
MHKETRLLEQKHMRCREILEHQEYIRPSEYSTSYDMHKLHHLSIYLQLSANVAGIIVTSKRTQVKFEQRLQLQERGVGTVGLTIQKASVAFLCDGSTPYVATCKMAFLHTNL